MCQRLMIKMRSLFRVEFVPCNKKDYYVIEIHVKPGDRNEIYSDGDDKVGSFSFPMMFA